MKRWLKIWPENADGWRGAISFVLIFLLIFFSLLPLINSFHILITHETLNKIVRDGDLKFRTRWELMGAWGLECSFFVAPVLFLASIGLALCGDWKRGRLGCLCLFVWLVLVMLIGPALAPAIEKPVLYLYPQTEQAVTVKLQYDGILEHTYPEYPDEGWKVLAKPSGELTNLQTGRTHYCLFWEGMDTFEYGLDEGFLLTGKDTAVFLESTLSTLGLSEREANEFIIYWLPRMEQNPYNLVSFPIDEYSRHARLDITPRPDTIIRVFMVFKAVDRPCEIKPQQLLPVTRRGFTVVEWGGTEIR